MSNGSVATEIVINHNLEIPCIKPSMEHLLEYMIDYEITKAEVIGTKLVTGDNPPLPIRKVIVDGIAHITVKYVALVCDQQVNGAHFDEPFSTLIVWPGGPPPSTHVCVEFIEEYVQLHQMCERKISKTIVLQLTVSIDK